MDRRAARAAIGMLAPAFVLLAASSWGVLPAPAAPRPESARPAPEDPADARLARAARSIVTVLGVRSHASLRRDARGGSRSARSLASGVILDARGRVVTVASAVRDCDAIVVRLHDGRERPAMLLGLDDDSDIALLAVDAADLVPLPLAPAGLDPVGEDVAVLGSGVGRHPRVSHGAVRRVYPKPLGSLLLLSNEVYPGTSGGAALNRRGELVGLIVGRLAEAPADWAEAPGAGAATFAVHGDDLRALVGQLERYGQVRRGFLGVRMVQGEVVDANRPGDPFRIGVRVEAVLAGSPAAQIDLRPGDLIVGWNGETLESPEDLMRRVEGSPPGTIVPLVWVRDEERHEGRLVVTARPEADLLATPVPGAGGLDTARQERTREELLERVRRLRARPAGAPGDTSRAGPGG